MTLAQIKQTLGIVALDLQRQLDTDKKPTAWLRNWDNLKRVAVVLHEDVLASIKKDSKLNTLTFKSGTEVSKDTQDKDGNIIPGSEYTKHILIISDSIEESI